MSGAKSCQPSDVSHQLSAISCQLKNPATWRYAPPATALEVGSLRRWLMGELSAISCQSGSRQPLSAVRCPLKAEG